MIMTVLDAANWAPSGMNRQQWEFLVVTGPKISGMAESYWRVVEEYTRNWDAVPMRGSLSREDFIRFAKTYGGAPIVIVVLTDMADTPDLRKANIESASAAMENLLLAATALGLGTCWMTGPLRDEVTLRRILRIPDEKRSLPSRRLVIRKGHRQTRPGTIRRLNEKSAGWYESCIF